MEQQPHSSPPASQSPMGDEAQAQPETMATSMSSLSSNSSARDIRRSQKLLLAESEPLPLGSADKQLSSPTLLPSEESSELPTRPTDQKKQRRQRRPPQSTSPSQPVAADTSLPEAYQGKEKDQEKERDQEDEQKERSPSRGQSSRRSTGVVPLSASPRRRPSERPLESSRRRKEDTVVVLHSPEGDECIEMDPADLLPSVVPSTSTPSEPLGQLRSSAAPVTGRDQSFIFVEDAGHTYRKSTRHAAAHHKRQSNVDGAGEDDVHQVASLLRRVNWTTLAVYYYSFGLLAGFSLVALLFLPLRVPSLPDASVASPWAETSSEWVRFLSAYGSNAMTFSNLFQLLSILALMHAMETKAMESAARHQALVEMKQSAHSKQLGRRLQRRAWITHGLLVCAWVTFLCTLAMNPLDDMLWNSLNDPQTVSAPFGSSSVQFRKSPFLEGLSQSEWTSITQRLATSSSLTSSQVVDWYWAGWVQSSVFQAVIKEWQPWVVLNGFRGVAGLLGWLFALLEIRFRASSSKRRWRLPH